MRQHAYSECRDARSVDRADRSRSEHQFVVRGRRAATALILLVLIVVLLVLPLSARDPIATAMGTRSLAGAPIAPAANLSNATSTGWLTFLGNENRSGD